MIMAVRTTSVKIKWKISDLFKPQQNLNQCPCILSTKSHLCTYVPTRDGTQNTTN